MFSENFKVRFYETDALKHVNNSVIVQWFESAREPVFEIFSLVRDLDNWPLIVASYKVDLLKQIYYGMDVEIRTYIGRIGNSSFDVYQEVWQQGLKCSTGTTTLVHFDYASQKSVPLTEHHKQQMQTHLYQLESA